jgi:hypothetical protein
MPRSVAIAACVAAALIPELYVLAIHAPGRIDSRGRHVEWLDEFGRGARIRQTFPSDADGLEQIAVMMRASRPTDAIVTWRLDLTSHGESTAVAALGRLRLQLPGGESWQTLPVSADAGLHPGSYALTLTLDTKSVTPGSDVAVANALDNPLHGSYLAVDDTPRWGDLVLQTRSKGDTLAGRFNLRVVPGLRSPFNHAWIWIGMLLVLNVLVAFTVTEIFASA